MNEDKKDTRNANMKWATMTETVHWPIDIGLGKTVPVEIVVATNHKAIKPNHEIRVYTAPTKRNLQEMSKIEYVKGGKRQRV